MRQRKSQTPGIGGVECNLWQSVSALQLMSGRRLDVRFVPKADILSATKKQQGSSQSAARRTTEGPVLTEIGKPMLGIESGKNFPARMAGCSSSNDWPLVYA